MDKGIWDYTHEDSLMEPEVGSEWMKAGHTPFDFIYGYGYDPVLEDVINQECVVKALNILIPKANTDSEELKQQLVYLQTELACVESEEWSEMCCSTLRDNIKAIEGTLRNLRKKSANALPIPRKPAEKIEDILKDLLRKYYPEKEQSPDVVVLDSKSDAAAHPYEDPEKIVRSQLDTDIAKESGENTAPIEMRKSMNSSPDHQGTGGSKRLKPTPKNTVDRDSDLIVVADSGGETKSVTVNPGPDLVLVSSDEEKIPVIADSTEVTGLLEAREQTPISKDGTTKESKSLKDEQRKSVEPAEATPVTSILRLLKYSKECVNMVKNLCKSDMKANQVSELNMEVATEDDATAPKDVHPKGDHTHGRTDEPQTGIVEYTSLDDFIERAACNAKSWTSQPKSSTISKTGANDSDLDEKIAEPKAKSTGKEGITGPEKGLGIGKTTIGLEQELKLKLNVGSDSIDPHEPKEDVNERLQSLSGNRISQPDPQSVTKKLEVKLDEKPRSPRAKRKSPSESESVKGKGVTPIPSTEKRQKIDASEDTACLKDVFIKNLKKLDPPKPSDRDHLFSLTQLEGSKSMSDKPVSPKAKELTVDLKFRGSNGNSSGNNPMKNKIPNATLHVPLSADDAQDMTNMKVAQLKVIAKELQILGISKMKKQDLIDKIKAKINEKFQR